MVDVARHPRLSPACIIAIGLLQTCKLLRAALGQDEPGQNDLEFFYAYGHSEAKDSLQGILKPFDEDYINELGTTLQPIPTHLENVQALARYPPEVDGRLDEILDPLEN